MNLNERLVNHVRTHPGQKAREIAAALGADKSEINSALYRGLGSVFTKLPDSRWQLIGAKTTAAGSAKQNVAESVPDGQLSALCRYYLDCLGRDVARDLSEWADSKYGDPQYAELAELPMIATEPWRVWQTDGCRRVLAKFQAERGKVGLFVGYPTHLYAFRSRDGREFWKVEPLFVSEYAVPDQRGALELADDRPEVNHEALKRLTGTNGADLLDEVVQLQQELGFDGSALNHEDLEDALSGLSSIRPDWPWKEPIEPGKLVSGTPLSTLPGEGIYNRAILLLGERSAYTQGLEKELTELGSTAEHGLRGTALESWLKENTAFAGATTEEPLLEVVPLNTEQRGAVRSALRERLTVITGPPGTGKSQVVTSIVTNCAWRGQTVLVASKTHKAVDVVEARVNSLGSRPILLRLGSGRLQSNLVEYLSSLLAARTEAHEQAQYEESLGIYKTRVAKREALALATERTLSTRNEVDKLEQSLEPLRDTLEPGEFQRLATCAIGDISTKTRRIQEVVRAAIREEQGFFPRLFWSLLREERLKAANAAAGALKPEAEKLGLSLSLPQSPGELRRLIEAIETRAGYARRLAVYFKALGNLRSATPLEDIAKGQLELDDLLAETSNELWQLWLQLQPARLDSSARKMLGDYRALLDLVVQANERGEKLGGQTFRKMYELFPKLTGVLPAWAVTNLSARGKLPMTAGFFDLLVIDEASQCDIPSVLPLLFRCKRAVIIGDPKQLSFITQIPPQAARQLAEQHDIIEKLGARWSYTTSSVFNLASSLCDAANITNLRDHHRSHRDIIGFSNAHFYAGKLRVATRYDRLRSPFTSGPAVRWIQVAGRVVRPGTGGAINDVEAKKIVAELRRMYLDQQYEGTVGVVTPFRAQANRIRDLVGNDGPLSAALGCRDFLAETAYKFQGDERDLVLFSPVVSADTPKTALGFLGGNPNTFNVAVTRARAALVVVGDQGACLNSGVSHLAAFAKHAAEVAQGAFATTSGDTEQDLGPDYPAVANPERVSDWERFLYQRLHRAGITTFPQYAVDQYCLDFAVIRGGRMLNVEVDGEQYHRAWNGELAYRDILRNRRLIELGWDVMRFWVYQVRDEPDACVQRVAEWVGRS